MASTFRIKFSGDFRLDILILIAYQLCHALSTQQIFPILLNYTPPIGCFETRCTEVKAKCYEDCDTCPNVCANVTSYEECEKMYRPDFQSAAMEYKIYCNSFYKSISATTVQYTGVLIGNLFVGYLADKYGRRLVLLLSFLLGIPALVISGIVHSLPTFYTCRFLVGISVAGSMSIGWTYCSEMISARHRFKLRTFTSYSLGRIVMIGLSQIAGEWRLATFLHAGLCCCTFILILFLPESIVWLRRTGDDDRIEKAEKKIAWIKGVQYTPVAKDKRGVTNQDTTTPQISLLDVLRNNSLRTSFLVLCVLWFSNSLSEYLTDLNGEDMSKHVWIGQYMSGLLASITRLILGIADGFLPWLGRRVVFLGATGVCISGAIALIVQLYLGMKSSTLYLITYLTAYNSIALTWEPNFLCASELMPTDVRAKSTAFLSILSRIGSLIASTMIVFKTIHEPVIMWTVLAANILTFFVALTWLKETKNCDLEEIGLSKRRSSRIASSAPSSPARVE